MESYFIARFILLGRLDLFDARISGEDREQVVSDRAEAIKVNVAKNCHLQPAIRTTS
jgi:hypothetical protein